MLKNLLVKPVNPKNLEMETKDVEKPSDETGKP